MLRYVMLGITLILGCFFTDTVALQHQTVYGSSIAIVELTERQKVDRLIQYVRGMKGAVFIRNGSEHSCQEAADHLQTKWKKHRDRIQSAEEFIEELASRSGFSGDEYKIRFADGTIVTTNAVLKQELKRLEQL